MSIALGTPAETEAAQRWRLRLGASLAALLALRIVALALNRTDLFFDEAQYWTWSLEPAFGYYSKPPLIAWVIALTNGVCGPTEFCIRLSSPIMHTLTAVALFGVGTRLYDMRTGFLSALAFATLPGVSLSAGIISTDVPLLMCWAIALYALVALRDEAQAWWPAILLGLAIGAGLNAKYAMAYFALCIGVWMLVAQDERRLLRDRRLWAGLGLGVALILPNLIWNASNRFATFSHTADNAKWSGSLLHPDKGLEFFGSQFGVFGPILFGVLLVTAWRWWKRGLAREDKLLLSFCLPILAIVTTQAFISRAHANWAAPAYVSASVLVVATLLRGADQRWLKASFWIHGAVLLALVLGLATAGRLRLPLPTDPFARTLGWKEVAAVTRGQLAAARGAGQPFGAVITDDRDITAELLYYMRGEPTPVLAWNGGLKPQDHYQMKRPFGQGSPEPVLLVALKADSKAILARFASAERIGGEEVPAGASRRRVTFYRLSGFKGF